MPLYVLFWQAPHERLILLEKKRLNSPVGYKKAHSDSVRQEFRAYEMLEKMSVTMGNCCLTLLFT